MRDIQLCRQPKTLFAGSSFGFSKTVSPPVRARLNMEGAAEPICSWKRKPGDAISEAAHQIRWVKLVLLKYIYTHLTNISSIHPSTSQTLSAALPSQVWGSWQHLYVVTAIDWPQIAACALETWQLLWYRPSCWKGLKINHFPSDSATGSGKATQNQSTRGVQEPTLFSLTFYPLSPQFLFHVKHIKFIHLRGHKSPCLWSGLQIFNLGSQWHWL